MGSNISVNDPALREGWNATIRAYLGSFADIYGREVAAWTINLVAEIALNIARKVQNTLDGNFLTTLTQIGDLARYTVNKTVASCIIPALPAVTTVVQNITTNYLATNQKFVDFCDLLLGKIVNKVLTHPVVMESFKGVLTHLLTQLGGEGPISGAIATILTDAISQLSQKAAGSVVPDLATSALVAYKGSRTDTAITHTRNVFVTSVTVNGVGLLVNLLYSFYLYRVEQRITGDEYKQYAKKQIKATCGTIVGGTAGGYVAILIAPNQFYIKMMGGVLGGLIGEQVGIRI